MVHDIQKRRLLIADFKKVDQLYITNQATVGW